MDPELLTRATAIAVAHLNFLASLAEAFDNRPLRDAARRAARALRAARS